MLGIATLLVLLALGTSASAQVTGTIAIVTPTLRQDITVASDIVRIGDLVGNAGAASNVPVFRAPDLGETGTVPVQRVIEALRPHAVIGLNTGGISDVVVTRASRPISPKVIETRIAQALAGPAGFRDAKNISLTFDRELRTIHLDPSATGDLQIVRAGFDARGNRFDVTIDLPAGNNSRRIPLRLSGVAVETAEAATLLRPLARGDILRSSDIVVEKRPKSEVGNDAIADVRLAVGLAARQPLRSGQSLRQADLMKPELVQRNETVVLIYEVPGIMLTLRGKAVDSGGEGDTVSVLNLQSKRTVQGVVTGPGRVTVSAPRVAVSAIAFNPVNSAPGRAE